MKNIIEMKKAIVTARRDGNRKLITPKMIEELGLSQAHFNTYKNAVRKLYQEVVNYSRTKNSPLGDIELETRNKELESMVNKIFPIWKDLLSMIEPPVCIAQEEAPASLGMGSVKLCANRDSKNDAVKGVSL